ncbi:MAG: hypothetical protein ACK54C_09630 [Betaproteobacteria bacterium]
MHTTRRLLTLTLPLLAASAVVAQNAPAAEDQTLDRVEITEQRDPEFIPYRAVFAYIEKFEQLRERDRIALVLRVVPQRDDVELSGLKVRLVGDGDYTRPIEVSTGGRLAVPYDRSALDHNADFMFNVRSGSLKPEINVLIRFNGQTISYRELMDSLKQADKAERELMTFAQRLMFPHSNAVAAGFGQGVQATVTIESARLGTQRLETNRRGMVGIEFNDELYAENPAVEFSTAPDWLIAAIAPRKSEPN